MKRYLPKNAEDASALILTLLVIVLLSTIVTSFLSSTRTEQTATRNYTSKTQAGKRVSVHFLSFCNRGAGVWDGGMKF